MEQYKTAQYEDLGRVSGVTLNQAVKKVKLSHGRVMDLINLHTNGEIMTKKYYKWTKTSNLYSYFEANTSNHYIWAIKKCEEIADCIQEIEMDKSVK